MHYEWSADVLAQPKARSIDSGRSQILNDNGARVIAADQPDDGRAPSEVSEIGRNISGCPTGPQPSSFRGLDNV
jgi:hypothetical protein